MKFLSSFLLLVLVSLANAVEESQDGDLAAAPSVAKEVKASSGSRGYGYPYRIAPTLIPLISSRSDDDEEKEAPVAQPKPFSSKLGLSTDPLKKSAPKKYKSPFSTRRLDSEEESSMERRFRSYKEPKYRNFAELESRFRPKRIELRYDSEEYDYSPKSYRRPSVSPRDPYLSPGDAPSDGFYPTVPKVKSYPSSYGHRHRDIPSYGAGRYEDPLPYHDEEPHYIKSNYETPSKYTPSHYDYQEDYAIESNKPITGDIRKRLLDYAGASDLYEGEPDYLQEVSRNKNKYGHVANDYYAYGGPGYRNSYREFPYVESKISILKKARV